MDKSKKGAYKSTSARIDQRSHDRLQALSNKSGVSINKLIALATAYYCEHVEQAGIISVPLKFEEKAEANEHHSS